MKRLVNSKDYGTYRCTHLLGATPYGAVYRATHVDDENQLFALRTLTIPNRDLDDILTASNKHLQAMQKIKAPNVIPVIDYGNDPHEFYIVTPYIVGPTLRQLIKDNEQAALRLPSFGEILNFTKSLGTALESLHDLDIAHGAIQPRNILITTGNHVYLADMGLSRLLKIFFALETTGSMWTGKYTAPEVWDGERITQSTDLYSFACVLYRLITGRVPFTGKSIFDQMKEHKTGVITPPHYVRADSPISLTMFFLTATAKTPPERFRSVQEFVTEFEMSLEGNVGTPTGFFDIPHDYDHEKETPPHD